MEQRREMTAGGEGRLPASAPLANPYVPFQQENPPVYEARKGLVRGTLFPGLDLPFMGMVNNMEKPVTPLTELQVLGFAIQDLVLYMDTHRDDKDALELLRSYQKIYAEGKRKYEKECGPLTSKTHMEGAYSWLNDPWPWEYAVNRED